MIGAAQVVETALAEAARLGRADETIVLVTDRSTASLRWAGNSMTTNGESWTRSTTVISIVRQANKAYVGSMTSSDVDPQSISGLVAASQEAARTAPEASDAATSAARYGRPQLTGMHPPPRRVPTCSAPSQEALARGFRGADRLYGFARHELDTTLLATSGGLRRRYTQPTGSVEINAKRDGASAWVGVGTPDFVDLPTDSMLEDLSTRLGGPRRPWSFPRAATRR